MIERVNSRVLGDAKNRFAFGVNAPSDLISEPRRELLFIYSALIPITEPFQTTLSEAEIVGLVAMPDLPEN